jgi:mRNA-degrading endonuclease RelE of RelBE toxin-antitoxin system
MTYQIHWTRRARRQVAESLPEAVATSALLFIRGPLAENPQRVGKRLSPPLSDRHAARRGDFRVIYQIDEVARAVTIWSIDHRSDAYRIH